MANQLSPDTLAQLQALGWAPQSASPPPQNAPPPAPAAPPDQLPPQAQQAVVGLAASAPPQPAPGIPLPSSAPPSPLAHAPASPAPYQLQGDQGQPPPLSGKVAGVFRPPPPGTNAGALVPGPSVVPAHAVSLVSPETRAGIERAENAQAQAAQDMGQANVAANESAADSAQAQSAQVALADVDARAAERVRQRAFKQQTDEYDRLRKDAESQRVDPERWWGSRSGAQKAAAIIGVALGGLADGGKNAALEIVNGAIDRDIDAQKSAIGQKNKAVESQRDMLQLKREQFGDERAAEAATRAQMLEQYKLKAQSDAMRSQSPILQAKARELAAQLSLEQAKQHAVMERWQPATVAGGLSAQQQKEIVTRLQAIRDKGATEGRDISVDEARRQATYEILGKDMSPGTPLASYAKGNGAAASDAVPPPKSTEWDPTRYLQGTQAFADSQGQDRWNAQVLAAVHQRNSAARGLEAIQALGSAYLVKPGDSQETIQRKIEAFKKDYGGKGQAPTGPTITPAGEE